MRSKKEGFMGERQVKLSPMVVDIEEHDPLTASLYITDIGYYPKADHHHVKRSEGIDQYVLIYCVDGCGWYSTGGKRYEVKQNQYFILPKNEPHEYGTNENSRWTIYWLHFKGEHASIYADGATAPIEINVAVNSRIGDRLNIFEEILTTLQYQEDVEDLRYASSLLHHFLASMRYLRQFRRAKQSKNNYEDDNEKSYDNRNSYGNGNGNGNGNDNDINIVDAAIHYMEENIENKIKLQQVQKYVGYSSTYFNTLFKRQTGYSPLQYFNRIKMEHACKLLSNTNLRINQICYKLGIEDSLYFSRLFSKTFGVSPSEYRKSSEKKE